MKFLKFNLFITAILAFSCEITLAAESITIETKNGNFFENLVSDTLLLLDSDLKKIIADDFDHVVANSKFEIQVNSWKPRPNPKTRLATIYDRFNSNNVKESLASLVQPVVEIACSPQKHDPLNESQSKCIKELFTYPIIQPIEIKYTYESNKTKDQYIADLAGLNNSNRYQQIVRTTADIMNSVYEKFSKKNVAKSVNIVKYPLPMFAGSPSESGKASSSSASSDCRKPRIGSRPSASDYTNHKTAMVEYQHCLDLETIKAGGNLGDIKQQRQADEMGDKMRSMRGQMSAQQAEMQSQQAIQQGEMARQNAEMQRQQAEMQRMRDQQNFNNIWKK